MKKIKINEYPIAFPKGLTCEYKKKTDTIELTIAKPGINLQENGAAFEGWSLILYANAICKKVVLSFEEVSMDGKWGFYDLDAEQQHYMRFLYRVLRFEEQMSSWFSVSKTNTPCVDIFSKHFSKVKKTNNVPRGNARYNQLKKGNEHTIEKAFVNFEYFRKNNNINIPLYDQLPNGLFVAPVSDRSRIFNSGYFDLWGFDPTDQSFNIYELKEPSNHSVGIVSELYFYANLLYDLLVGKNLFELNPKPGIRNYNVLLENDISKIKAFFLVVKEFVHPEIKKQITPILNLLNKNTQIRFGFHFYDIDDKMIGDFKKDLHKLYPHST